MARFLTPEAVFYSADGGEWWVSPPLRNRKYHVFGPWTCDSLASFDTVAQAISYAEDLVRNHNEWGRQC